MAKNKPGVSSRTCSEKEQVDIPSAYRKFRDTAKGSIVRKEGGKGVKWESEAERIRRFTSSPPTEMGLKAEREAQAEEIERAKRAEAANLERETKAAQLREEAMRVSSEMCDTKNPKKLCFYIVIKDEAYKVATVFKRYGTEPEAWENLDQAVMASGGPNRVVTVMSKDQFRSLGSKGYIVKE